MSEWINPEYELPKISGQTVLAACLDYTGKEPMVVPAKYDHEKEQWYDVECVDNCGDPNEIYSVTFWTHLPEPPQ